MESQEDSVWVSFESYRGIRRNVEARAEGLKCDRRENEHLGSEGKVWKGREYEASVINSETEPNNFFSP